MTRFAVETEQRDDARIISIRGELDAADAREIDLVLLEAAGDPDRVLIVSLVECDSIDSAAVAALFAAYRRGLGSGGRGMSLVCRTESQVGRRLGRAGLDRAIPVYESVADAAFAAVARPRVNSPTELFQL